MAQGDRRRRRAIQGDLPPHAASAPAAAVFPALLVVPRRGRRKGLVVAFAPAEARAPLVSPAVVVPRRGRRKGLVVAFTPAEARALPVPPAIVVPGRRARRGMAILFLPPPAAGTIVVPQTFRAALTAKLGSIAELAAIVGTAIYPGALPEDHELDRDGPALTYTITSNPRGHVLAGSDGTSTAHVQLDAWSYLFTSCESITDALWNDLDGPPGTWGNGTCAIMSVTQQDESDMHEPPKAGTDQWVYHIQNLYQVKYRTGFPTLS